MDTIIFLLILVTLAGIWSGKRWLIIAAFFATLLATLLLFNHHVTESLPLNF